jgi:hypothetical protein
MQSAQSATSLSCFVGARGHHPVSLNAGSAAPQWSPHRVRPIPEGGEKEGCALSQDTEPVGANSRATAYVG